MTAPDLTPAAAAVVAYARQVLGDEADAWLNAPHDALDGQTPMSQVKAWPGRVEGLIIRMEEAAF